MVIRQLGFVILQLTQQIAELIGTMQYVLFGKLPIHLRTKINQQNAQINSGLIYY